MADSERWTVTYTKHLKQKRKLYHDGFLHLHTFTNKVMLYDECDKLLVCKVLKDEEAVKSGETLEFNGYLVDIGAPECHGNKAQSDFNFNVDTKHNTASRFKTPYHTKINGKENIAQSLRRPLSPSQKVIKEFKKRELLKYASPKITPETTKPSTTEYQVLYTTQMTQKAKKYHDGFLRLVICGSRGEQVMLLDASRKLLDSRFLKKDDIIRPGESFAFDAYLVDIVECQGSHIPATSVQGIFVTNVERIENDKQQTSVDTDTYATVGKSGQSSSKPCLGEDAGLNSLFTMEERKSNSAFQPIKPLHDGEHPSMLCLGQDGLNSLSSMEEEKSNGVVPPIEPLRDASEILSFLQDPMPQESYVTGHQSPNRACQDITDRESTETMKSSLSVKACGDIFQFTENVKMSHQGDTDLSILNPGGHSSCHISIEDESAEELSCKTDAFPSFDLGF